MSRDGISWQMNELKRTRKFSVKSLINLKMKIYAFNAVAYLSKWFSFNAKNVIKYPEDTQNYPEWNSPSPG